VDYTVTHVNSSPRRRPQMSRASQLLMVDGKSVKPAMPGSEPTISITLRYVNFFSQHLSLIFSPSLIGGHALPSVFKTSPLLADEPIFLSSGHRGLGSFFILL